MQRLGGKNNEMPEHGLHCPFPFQLNIVHIVEQAGMRLENRSNEGKTITAARFPWVFLPRERDAGCKCRDGGKRDACTALHLT